MVDKKKKTLKEQAEERFGKKDQKDLKEKLNAWLDKSVNQPLAKKGFEKTGAGLSALGSAAGEMFIPESGLDVLLPGAFFSKGGKTIKKMIKPKSYKNLEVPDTKESRYAYDDIKIPEIEANTARAKVVDDTVNAAKKKAKEADEKRKKWIQSAGTKLDYSKMK